MSILLFSAKFMTSSLMREKADATASLCATEVYPSAAEDTPSPIPKWNTVRFGVSVLGRTDRESSTCLSDSDALLLV